MSSTSRQDGKVDQTFIKGLDLILESLISKNDVLTVEARAAADDDIELAEVDGIGKAIAIASQAGPTQIIFPDTAPEQNTNTAFGEFWFYNFGNTSKYKTCFFRTSWWSASEYLETITGTLYIESTSAIDAIRLAADHGTMRTGNLRLYGLSN